MAYKLKSPVTPGKPDEYRGESSRAVRPVDAATLIIIRELKGQTSILMGKRSAKHKFMPNKFVFPGGRVDPIDSRISAQAKLPNAVEKRLAKHISVKTSPTRIKALALAAIRETFEETGLVVGEPAKNTPTTRNIDWKNYFEHGVQPPLHAMDMIARAITPPHRVRRFDTRFFTISADYLHTHPEDLERASGELTDLHWIAINDAFNLDLPVITKQVLGVLQERLQLPSQKRVAAPALFFRFYRGQAQFSKI